jgi:signal transduction histidine kinase
VLISVHDTGPGISPELQTRLFQKFVTGSHKGRGSGLGLAFCKLVVEAHDQQIWVDSMPGQGTIFTFTLPVAR